MTEGVSAMHQTSMAWRHLHRKDDIWPMAKTQGKKQLGKESNSNSQNWKRKCENKDWNHGIDTAYSGYRVYLERMLPNWVRSESAIIKNHWTSKLGVRTENDRKQACFDVGAEGSGFPSDSDSLSEQSSGFVVMEGGTNWRLVPRKRVRRNPNIRF